MSTAYLPTLRERIRNRTLAALLPLLALLSLCSANVFANEADAGPEAVTIGAYINGIHNIDLKAGTVELDMYIWLRSRIERDLLESIEIQNGSITERSAIERKKLGELNYSTMRMTVKLFQNYDLSAFPLDSQQLTLHIEDAVDGVEDLKFVADTQNTKVAQSLSLPGWSIGKAEIHTDIHNYDTNYGDLAFGADHSDYSRAVITIPIDRQGIGYFFKLFSTVFLSAVVAFLAFFIRPDDLDPRFGVGIGALFAVVASNFVLSSMLPETHQLTMGESLLLLTMALIFLSLLESVVVLKLWEAGKETTSLKIDRITGWTMPIAYAVLTALIVAAY